MSRIHSGCTAVAALAFAFAALASGASGAATPASSFCTAAKSVAANIVNVTAIGNEGESPSQLKAFYENIVAAKPALLRTAPGPLKAGLTPVFSYVTVVIADLQEAGWDPDMLAPVLPDLNARAAKLKAPLKALKAYFDGTCKLRV
jgi:hypothetical protein